MDIRERIEVNVPFLFGCFAPELECLTGHEETDDESEESDDGAEDLNDKDLDEATYRYQHAWHHWGTMSPHVKILTA